MKRFPVCVVLLCALTAAAAARNGAADTPARPEDTPAYRILTAREAAAAAELEKMLTMYTPSFPGVRSKQFELDILRREEARMVLTAPERLDRLSAAYGDMVLRRVALEVEVRDVLTMYKPRHPIVREKLSALSRAEGEALEHLR
ncbi:MAG: hypothetical protein M3416_13175 [Acidobacteriota bacterium]|nr:hypothetical protein [Acidobacteriota bacterium]